mmetsp:Transcript_56871/g.176374  ORF Transcript_56871/g.176374 Transcript_56871/m.176374 type:complete len:136 (-) Transcript_56871:349-756(-)
MACQELRALSEEQREKQRRHADSDKENRYLKQAVQEQKNMLHDLRSQLHREETRATFLTPGEYIRMAKKQEGDTFAHENAELKMRNFGLDTELKELRWHNEVMRRHLPQSEWDRVVQELVSQPLPVREPKKESGV